MAHRLLDEHRYALGHELLGPWLDQRSGTGTEWVHLHWHMAVFELALDCWTAAFSRFRCHILPAAATTEDALTDAPSLLWRLTLAARTPVTLPWEPLRATALARMRRPSSPYLELHNLLALAGAGDVESLDDWLRRRNSTTRSRAQALVLRMAMGLQAFVVRDYGRCAAMLATTVPHVRELGGSHAQNQLFKQLEDVSRAKAGAHGSPSPFAEAA